MSRFAVLAACAGAALAVAAPTAWAANPVEIQGVEEDLRERIAAVLPDRDRPDSVFAAERLAEEAAERGRAFLRSEGYYAAAIEPHADAQNRAWISIELGARFRFAPFALVFDQTPPRPETQTAVRNALSPVRPETPARSADVLAAEQAGLTTLRDAGYPDAAVGQRNVVVDHATRLVTTTFHFNAGELAQLGRVRVSPEGVINDALAQRMRSWRPGDRYRPDYLRQLRRAASRTGAFASVATTLAPEADAQGRRDVILTLEPLERRTIELGVGYSTTEGAGGDIEWTRRNQWRRAETLTLAATISSLTQRARASLALPYQQGLGRITHYTLQGESSDEGPYHKDAVSASWSVDAEPRQAYALSYGVSASAEFYDDSAGVNNAYILSGFLDARRDTTNAPLDAREGHILQGRLEPGFSTGDESLFFARFIGDARYYETPDFAEEVTFAGRAHVGYVAPIGGDENDLPLSRLFYAGGGGSVRGYAYNSIYPGAPAISTTNAPGGQALVEVSAEARWRFRKRWGLVGFLDGGSAFNDQIDLLWGAGVGVRYDLGFAPVRVDFAVPLSRRSTDDAFVIYASLGQAF
jgi:translocation and assembly module TamA